MIELIQGDSSKVILEIFDRLKGAVLVTDPPYGISGGRGGDSRAYAKGAYQTDNWEDSEEYIRTKVVPTVTLILNHVSAGAITPGIRCLSYYPKPDDMGCFWHPAAVTHGPWGFITFNPILYYGRDWRAGRGPLATGRTVTEVAEKCLHPCPKPIGAWSWLIDKVCPPGGTVIDPYMGSGTGGVACALSGRNFIGIEIQEEYYLLAQERVKQAEEEYVRQKEFFGESNMQQLMFGA